MMSEKVKTSQAPIRSFADLPRSTIVNAVEVARPPSSFVNWDVGGMTLRIIAGATETLESWLRARLTLLLREKVAMEDISIVNRGGRTVIRVLGRDRYEFKIKCQMEER